MKQISNLHIQEFKKLITVGELRDKLPITVEAEQTIIEGRQSFFDIFDGKEDRFVVITGPCSIHDPKSATEYAKNLVQLNKTIQDKMLVIMRVYFEKPRTSVGWKGMINDPYLNGSNNIEFGLHASRQLLIQIAEMGLPTATEFLDPIIAGYLGELVTWVAIGARTSESQPHRQMASGLSAPVGFKNGTDGNLDVALNAIKASTAPHSFVGVQDDGYCAIVSTNGNPYSHIVLRGGGGKPNYHREDIADCEIKLKDRGFPEKIIVDCSHDNSNKTPSKQAMVVEDIIAQKKIGNNQSIFGIMIESNLYEGRQDIPENPKNLEYGVSITDACLSWADTEKLLLNLYHNL